MLPAAAPKVVVQRFTYSRSRYLLSCFLASTVPSNIRGCQSGTWSARSVCFVFSYHSFWTSSSLDAPAGVTQEEGHTGFLIHLLSAVPALIFLARRIQPFLSLVDREVEFCDD